MRQQSVKEGGIPGEKLLGGCWLGQLGQRSVFSVCGVASFFAFFLPALLRRALLDFGCSCIKPCGIKKINEVRSRVGVTFVVRQNITFRRRRCIF